MKATIIASFLLVLFCTATAAAQGGEEIVLKVGETKTSKDSDTRLSLVAVLEDSRCPKDVDCIWAGRVRVRVQIGVGKGEAATLELSSEGEERSIKFKGRRLYLVKLTPERSAEKAPEECEYTAYFQFEKQ